MRRVGIIGGMGPLASIDLYTKITLLTPAMCDQDHIPLIIDNSPQIPDRTAFILGSGENPLPALIQSAKRLEQAGAKAVAIACNTAHFFADEIQKEIQIPIIHIAKSAVNAIKNNHKDVKNVAVIATTGTIKTGIYDKKLNDNNLNTIKISKQDQDSIMQCIYQGVKSGKTDEVAELFNETISHIKADAYIAGCTEIPILMPYLKNNYLFIDATLELAKDIINFSKNTNNNI